MLRKSNLTEIRGENNEEIICINVVSVSLSTGQIKPATNESGPLSDEVRLVFDKNQISSMQFGMTAN